MDKNSLRKLISGKLGVSSSKQEFAFEVFLQKIGNALEVNETIKIPGVGFFQLKQEPLLKDERKISRGGKKLTKRTMFFSPFGEQENPDSSSLFLSFDVDLPQKDFTEFDENIFSIGIQKPIAPIFEEDENLASLQKSMEARIDEIISTSEKVNDFDFFENYINQVSEEKQTEPEDLNDEMSDDEIQRLFGKPSKKFEEEISETEPLKIPEIEFDEPENIIEEKEETIETEKPEAKEENPFDALDDINLAEEEIKDEKEETVKEEIPEKKIEAENAEEKTKSSKKKETPSFESIFENDNDLINAVLPLPDAADSKMDTEIEDEEDSVEWDWGDELNAEFQEDPEDERILPSPGEGEDEIDDGLTDEEKHDFDNLTDNLDDEIDDIKINEEQTDAPDLVLAKKLSETYEQENQKPEEKEESKKVVKKTALKSYDWKNQSYGKGFWILLGTFILFTVFGLYYLLFWGGEKQKAPETKTILDADTTSVKVDTSQQIIAKVDTSKNVDTAVVQKTETIKEPVKETIKEPIKVAAVEIPSTEEKTLYRKFANEVRINNRIYSDGKRFMVQVSSFKTKNRAENDAYKYKNLGHDAFIVEANLPQLGGTWYRVRIGYFNSQKDAENFIAKNNL